MVRFVIVKQLGLTRVWWISAISGLWYQRRKAAGSIGGVVIRINRYSALKIAWSVTA